jgi:uncharacterized protein YjbI with pentapeptide repeats
MIRLNKELLAGTIEKIAMHRPFGRQDYANLAILGLALVIAVFLLAELIGWFECWGCDRKDIAKAISDARASLLQVVVGVAGAAALYFTWQTYLLGREGRASDNFIKAIDQLGNKNVHAKIGGVAGLGRLLKLVPGGSPHGSGIDGDYWPIMDTLTAFVRQSIPVANTPRAIKPPEDIQTAINVIARRYLSDSEPPSRTYDSPVDLSQCDLSRLWMGGGHYEGGYFEGSVFRDARLEGSYLRGADFTNADLTDANLSDAIFDRYRLDPHGVPVGESEFKGDATFDGATLTNAKLNRAKMQKASIRRVNAQGASFKKADLTGASFERSNLTGASFEYSNLTGTSFQGAIVWEADFSNAIVQTQTLLEAVGNLKTKLPPGFSRPPEWETSERRAPQSAGAPVPARGCSRGICCLLRCGFVG